MAKSVEQVLPLLEIGGGQGKHDFVFSEMYMQAIYFSSFKEIGFFFLIQEFENLIQILICLKQHKFMFS